MKLIKMAGKIALLILECIGYLLLTLSLLWIVFDIFPSKKSK